MKKKPVAPETETAEPVADLAPPEPAMEAQTAEPPPEPARYVVGMLCRTNGPHEIDGTLHPHGAEVVLPCALASAHGRRGDVSIIKPIEETIHV